MNVSDLIIVIVGGKEHRKTESKIRQNKQLSGDPFDMVISIVANKSRIFIEYIK